MTKDLLFKGCTTELLYARELLSIIRSYIDLPYITEKEGFNKINLMSIKGMLTNLINSHLSKANEYANMLYCYLVENNDNSIIDLSAYVYSSLESFVECNNINYVIVKPYNYEQNNETYKIFRGKGKRNDK